MAQQGGRSAAGAGLPPSRSPTPPICDAQRVAEIARHLTTQCYGAAQTAGLDIRTNLQPAPVTGDPVLLERLTQNLLDNAIRYNLPEHGEITVTTGTTGDNALLTVENTGPPVPS